ncbi:DUF5819 family protein [Streptomyces sp. BRA346]|uniref:DUF5819 family protein n=1 Tax=Streptomyces sp. BRA346 TaxID=2878199 RepID=UPI0040639CBF
MRQQAGPDAAALSGFPLAVLTAGAVVLLGAVLWHLTAMVLSVTPPNSINRHYRKAIDGYVHPQFDQNWKLFAPDPPQSAFALQVRVRTGTGTGAAHTGRWQDLTAEDIAAIRNNPAPSHVDQDLIPVAWTFYQAWHEPKGERPIGVQGDLSTRHLKRTVLRRVGPERNGRPVTGIQVRCLTEAVPPPRWSSEKTAAPHRSYRVLPWWPVAGQDYRGL